MTDDAPIAVPASPFAPLLDRALLRLRHIASGNGVDTTRIQAGPHELETYTVKARSDISLSPVTEEKTRSGRHAVGTVCSSRDDMREQAASAGQGGPGDTLILQAARQVVLKRPDQGFGLRREPVVLPPSLAATIRPRLFSAQENCGACGGACTAPCPACNATGRTLCVKCHGHAHLVCPTCRGTHFVYTADHKQKPCPHCRSAGRIPCKVCQRTGKTACRACQSSGRIACPSCQGSGGVTHVMQVTVQPVVQNIVEKSGLPAPLSALIDRLGPRLVGDGHAATVVEEEGAAGLRYTLSIPYGTATFSIDGAPVKTGLFGQQARLLDVPPFLEEPLKPALEALHQAATAEAGTALKLRRAAQCRIIGESLLASLRHPPARVAKGLSQQYPVGVQPQTFVTIANLCGRALRRVTEKQRLYGVALGLALATLLYGLYFLTPVRTMLAAKAGTPGLMIPVDLMLLAVGCFIASQTVHALNQRTLKIVLADALARLKNPPRPLSGRGLGGTWRNIAFGAAAYILTITAGYMFHIGSTPEWVLAGLHVVQSGLF